MGQTRRGFLKRVSLAGAGVIAARHEGLPASLRIEGNIRPVAVASANGLRAVQRAMEIIQTGKDALDGVIAGVNIVEQDPEDTSVGYGGLPNEDGVVELDAAVMHGPTHRAGAVASLRNIREPSRVARTVMERTDHVLLVGEGALRFARAHGFQEQELLTDGAREAWLHWKENLTPGDDWLPVHDEKTNGIGAAFEPFIRNTGTIHCSAVDRWGGISSVTTTSGLAFKIPGRVGDSPIIGAGLYVDNTVGAAGSTGRGEANLINCSCVMVVEFMRRGRTPEQACLDACRRIVDKNHMRRLQDERGRPTFNVLFYAVNKRGEFGGAAIYSGHSMAVHDGTSARLVALPYLYTK